MDGCDRPCFDWELIDLRHGGTYHIGNACFFWYVPVEDFSCWRVTNVQACYTYRSGLFLKDAIRSWLGPRWDQALALMEFLAQMDVNEILGPGDHDTYTGLGNSCFDAREASV